jgi:hypothetical protein
MELSFFVAGFAAGRYYLVIPRRHDGDPIITERESA